MSDGPWSFGEAREACRNASAAQTAAEQALKDAARDAAQAEAAYRVALATKIVELHDGGLAWSVCGDVARGDEEVAELKRLRDIAEGVREAMTHAAWKRAADRRDAQRFADWSQRREFAETGGEVDPTYEPPIGGRPQAVAA